jgi:hypothetical protein
MLQIVRITEESDVHSPLVLRFGQRAGPIDNDFALSQYEVSLIEQRPVAKSIEQTPVTDN